jgi:hypothetical protein
MNSIIVPHPRCLNNANALSTEPFPFVQAYTLRRSRRRGFCRARCILEVCDPYPAVFKQREPYFRRPRALTRAEQLCGLDLGKAEGGESGAERNGVAAGVCSSVTHVIPPMRPELVQLNGRRL